MVPPTFHPPPEPEDDLLRALAAVAPSLARLAARGVARQYHKGMLLIQEGERGDTVYVILSGRLRAFGQGDNGKEITYGTYGLGDLVGEMSLDGGPRSASVRAVEDAHCAVITRRTLELHIAEEPSFAFELLAKVIRLARTATLSTKQLALNDVYGRVKVYLESHAVPQADGSLWLPERPTHQQMADSLGCSRPMVSRVMKTLLDGGYVIAQGDGLRLNGRLPMRW